ncbi:Glycogenin-1 [Nymphon striatum]|nr:Glycogenin-1 [Nymphon striatum]
MLTTFVIDAPVIPDDPCSNNLPSFELLESVFDAIYSISDHELKLVGDPELGVSYNKIHVWKLTKFSKCVFLDCDMFVVKNCDELFERTEFSAVPDIGWPDCFNSGVFVYVPSDTTFKQLLKTAQLPTIVDGGEQGLLNIYFGETWKSSINCRLPFIYNLMANVSYTYIPAFKQLLQDMAKKFSSMTVRNLMKMYQHFVGEQSDHLPSNPSMRVRYTDTQQHLKLSLDQFKWDINVEETAEEIFEDEKYTAGLSSEMDESIDKDMQRTGESSDLDVKSEVEVIETEDEKDKENIEENISETEVDSTLPDYNRMYLWEKGQMDYAGSDSSNNIMKKLDSLINRAKIN